MRRAQKSSGQNCNLMPGIEESDNAGIVNNLNRKGAPMGLNWHIYRNIDHIINEYLSLEKRNQPQAGAFLNLHIWMSAMAEPNSTNLITNPNVCFCCFAG
jgi:hypothetical protein